MSDIEKSDEESEDIIDDIIEEVFVEDTEDDVTEQNERSEISNTNTCNVQNETVVADLLKMWELAELCELFYGKL